MQKEIKILVNGLTLDDANLVPLVKKLHFWSSKKAKIIVIGSQSLFKKIGTEFQSDYINLGNLGTLGGGFDYLRGSLRRNLFLVKQYHKIPTVDVVYSVSSVLDLILWPYILKKTKKAQKWLTVFDNTVPLFANGRIISGNFLVRLLAWFFYRCSLFFLRSADSIFVVKPELKTYLINKSFPPNKIIVTGNGVEADLIKKAKYKKELDFDGLYLGRINEAKGVFDLLRVVREVKQTLPSFRLAIVGSGDTRTIAKLKLKISELDLKKSVVLLGFKSGQEKYDIIKSSKIFLFLSQTESVPVAPLEAVCSGKIALVYDLDAYKMYKKHEVKIFKQGDYRKVAEEVLKIIKSGNFTNKAGQKLLNKYDWESIAETEYNRI